MTQIVSSISSIEIYAPSAGSSTYAKCDTNGRALTKMVESADVSAFQVVSATGSQLYAGTAHLTSVNTAPISASRAGQAANASMANSAYYDGTGRLISALPDSATVSAIASGYVSSKADASSLSSYALSADVSGVIDTVSSNSASWAGGGGLDSATVSAIASSYADKCWPLTSTANLIPASGQGVIIRYGNEHIDIGKAGTFSPMTINYSYGGYPTANFGIGGNSVYGGRTASTSYWTLNRTGVSGNYYDGTAWHEWHYTTAEYDKLTSTHDTVSANSASWAGGAVSLPITGSAGSDSATYAATSVELVRNDTAGEPDIRSAHMSPDQFQINYTYNNQDYTSMLLNENMLEFDDADGAHIVDAYSIDTWNSAVDTVANNSASWGQGGVDSATVSSIASSYAESAVSGVTDTVSANSASWGGGATGDYVEKSSLNTTIGSSNDAFGLGLAHGIHATAGNRGYAFGQDVSANDDSFACGSACTAVYGSFAHGTHASSYLESFADGWYVTARNSATAFGQFNSRGNGSTALANGSAAFVIGDGTSDLSRHDLMLVTKDGELTMYSSTSDTVGLGLVSSIKAISANAGGPVTATASAKATAYTSTGTDSYVFTGISSVNDSALLASNLLPNAQQANGNAHFHFMPTTSPWGSTEYTGLLGPLQYATGAALAMKQTNAYGAYYKGNEWFISDVGTNTAANGVVRAELHRTRGIHLYGSSLNSATGFHLNGSGVDGKSGASAWQYGPTEYHMLIDVNNTVNTQSANWGGSALALSAGPGITLTKSGDTLLVELTGPILNQETPAGYWNGSAVYQRLISASVAGNTSTDIPIPDSLTGSDIAQKWIDPSNSFVYYNASNNVLPLSWSMGSGRYGSVGFVGSVISYRCIDTTNSHLSAYITLKYIKV